MSTYDPPYQSIRDMGFPTVEQLRHGIVLGCIAHSFWLAAEEPVFQQFWDGDTYLDDQLQGERWAVAFVEEGAVAVFYSSESSRNPYPKGSPLYDQSRFFEGMPEGLGPAKKRALSWMLDLDFRLGGPNAVVTTTMWAEGSRSLPSACPGRERREDPSKVDLQRTTVPRQVASDKEEST